MAFSLISGMIPFIAMLLFPAKQLVNKHHLKTHSHHEFEGSILEGFFQPMAKQT